MAARFTAYKALMGFTCQAPIFALFYLSNGVNYQGLMTIAVVFAIAKTCFDVPAGLLADRFGRKKAVLARIALEAVSVVLLFDRQFIPASALAGIGCAFSSGAETSLAYEGFGRDFPKNFGRASSWGFSSTAIAALAGGWLGTVSFDLVYMLRLTALVAAGAVAFGFEEPARPLHRAPAPSNPARTGLVRILVIVGIVGAVQVAALHLQQPFIRQAGVPLASLGILYVVFQGVSALGARAAHRLPRSLRMVTLLSTAGFVVMSLPIGILGVMGIFLLKFAHGISLPSVGKALSERTDPSRRATALSLRSLYEGAALLVAAPALGWAASSMSLASAFGLAALILAPSVYYSEVPCASS
jgi:MFS family permease